MLTEGAEGLRRRGCRCGPGQLHRGACRWPRGGPAGGGEAAPTWQGHHSVWPTWASPGSSTRAPGQWPDGRATSKTAWWPKQQRHLETTPLSGFLAAQPSSRPRRNQKATGRRSCPGGLPASGAGLGVAAGVTGGVGEGGTSSTGSPSGSPREHWPPSTRTARPRSQGRGRPPGAAAGGAAPSRPCHTVLTHCCRRPPGLHSAPASGDRWHLD